MLCWQLHFTLKALHKKKLILPNAPFLQKPEAHSYQYQWPCTLYGWFQKSSLNIVLFVFFCGCVFFEFPIDPNIFLRFFVIKITFNCVIRMLQSSLFFATSSQVSFKQLILSTSSGLFPKPFFPIRLCTDIHGSCI